MNQNLTDGDIDNLLRSQLYGHIGCRTVDDRLYVVPITYAYHDGCIYSFSSSGMKIEAMRKNPSVCFQVEQFHENGSWKSVIAWGTFEELTGTDRTDGMKLLFRRLEQDENTAISPLYQPPKEVLAPQASQGMKEKDAVFYRIRITERTGKSSRYV
jgi:nitroimidazol reductase NimA-like FMN-containing flavoprotein (pyridoxamine 5'-phosphate oxidase superfamily)